MNSSKKCDNSRKNFLKKLGITTAALTGLPLLSSKGESIGIPLGYREKTLRPVPKNEYINLALIGAGEHGQYNIVKALETGRFKIVAASDLFDSRLINCKERWGDDLFVTRDYREVLDRDDVDAVVIATSDHWHDRITIDALNKNIPVYLEKPMVQHLDQGYAVIEAEKNATAPLIVGSQLTSSIVFKKAGELFRKGEIGVLNFVEAYWDRLSAIGAWQYSIPPSASPENIDWDRFRKGLPAIPFNAKHFFRWRNYDDYGTGVAGDLFVHMYSALHMMVDSIGPEKIIATGGLRHWHDGRDAEDFMLSICDYPETLSHPAFNLSLRVNFADGSGGGSIIRMVGSEGEMVISRNRIVLRKMRLRDRPGMSINDFSRTTRKEYKKYYEERYPEARASMIEPDELVYRAPDGYDWGTHDHFINFYDAIRDNKPVLQDGKFGFRAAAPALLATSAHRENRIIRWDADKMKVI